MANSGSLTREPTAALSAGQPKSLQHLFVGIPLKRFALRFAEGQGQAGVVCGTVEEQVGRAPVSFKESCIKAARGQVSTDVPLDWL